MGLPRPTRRAALARWALAAGLALPLAARASEDGQPPAPSASELLQRAFHNLYADDYVQTMELATRSQHGRVMTRRLQITRKQSANPGKALVRFLDPYQIRRTSILILEHEGATDDLYVYLPAARRTRHLSSSQRADSFFGTDLSYEDVEPKYVDDYRARLAGAGELDGAPCLLVEFEAAPHFESTYEQMRSCIEAERGVIYWTEFFRKGTLVKRLQVDPGSIRAIGTRHIPFSMTLETPRRGTQTVIRTERYELSPEIPDGLFTTWNLEAGDADRDRQRAGAAEAGALAAGADPGSEGAVPAVSAGGDR